MTNDLYKIRWLKSPIDLFEVYSKDELLIQRLSGFQKVVIRKSDSEVKIISTNGFDLSRKLKSMVESLSCLTDNFELLGGVSLTDSTLEVFDIFNLNGKALTNVSFEERYHMLQNINHNESFKVVEAESCPDLRNEWTTPGAVLIKSKKSLLGPKEQSGWYYYDRRKNVRRVIIASYYFGNRVGKTREVIFRCTQYRSGRPILVGKIRVGNDKTRRKLMKLIDKNKRAVVLASVDFDTRNSQKYSKLSFISQVFDEKFRDVVVDEELYFRPLIVVNIRSPKKSKIVSRAVYKNLNRVSGAI